MKLPEDIKTKFTEKLCLHISETQFVGKIILVLITILNVGHSLQQT